MRRHIALLAGLLFGILGLRAVTVPAQATPVGSAITLEMLVHQPAAQKVAYGYCVRWHRRCRYRWAWGPRYRRCMALHGCWFRPGYWRGRRYGCAYWVRQCRINWGGRPADVAGCLRYHGCY